MPLSQRDRLGEPEPVRRRVRHFDHPTGGESVETLPEDPGEAARRRRLCRSLEKKVHHPVDGGASGSPTSTARKSGDWHSSTRPAARRDRHTSPAAAAVVAEHGKQGSDGPYQATTS